MVSPFLGVSSAEWFLCRSCNERSPPSAASRRSLFHEGVPGETSHRGILSPVATFSVESRFPFVMSPACRIRATISSTVSSSSRVLPSQWPFFQSFSTLLSTQPTLLYRYSRWNSDTILIHTRGNFSLSLNISLQATGRSGSGVYRTLSNVTTNQTQNCLGIIACAEIFLIPLLVSYIFIG